MSNELKGKILLSGETSKPLALEQVELLKAIDETGSISAAAQRMGISYKTAWDRLERLTNLSKQPLIQRTAGGSRGGGSTLTDYGRDILNGFSALKQEHSEFINTLGNKLTNLDDLSNFVRGSQMTNSAGNQFLGQVLSVVPGAVNAEITISISEVSHLVAIITEKSCQDLKLQVGTEVIVLVKDSSILLSDDPDISVSARNKIVGRIKRIERGAVNTSVGIDIGSDRILSATITNAGAESLGLQENMEVCAFFKASSVILLGT